MAPMIRQDTAEVVEDLLNIEEDYTGLINFEEISNLATSGDLSFDNTKLIGGNDVALIQPPAVEVQPAMPQQTVEGLDVLIPTFDNSDYQPASPEFVAMHSLPFEYLGFEPSHTEVQPVFSPSQQLIEFGPELISTELQVMQPVNPEEYNIEVQPASPQESVMSQECSSLGADSFLVSPSPVMKPEPYSPMTQQLDVSQECLSLVPSPAEFFVPSPSAVVKLEPSTSSLNEQRPADGPKKRGRKRKYPEGTAPRSRRPKKPKAYEIVEPLADEKAEKKRKNAINAKRHRDMQKQEKEKLSDALTRATAERDHLVDLLNQYKQREQHLVQMLNSHGIIVGLENL